MTRWFRHYAGMMRDDKLVRVAVKSKQTVERVTWIWGAILESAAEIDDGGLYEIDHEEIAYFLRADVEDIAAIEAALAVAGRVEGGRVLKWKDRQFQTDRTGGKSRGSESYVYFIGQAWGEAVKIGFSRNPWSRVAEFQTGSPAKLSVLAAFKTSANSEIDIHGLLAEYRRAGEWFDLPQEATQIIEGASTGKKSSYEELVVALRSALRSATNTETDLETDLETDTEPTVSHEPVGARAKARRSEHAQILDCLMEVLSEDRAKAVIEHRRKKKAPLGLHAAKLLVEQFRQIAEPDKAADLMVLRGWQGCEPDWCVKAGLRLADATADSGTGPPPVFVLDGSPELRAWQEAEPGKHRPIQMKAGVGCYVPTRFPQSKQESAA